MSRVSTYLNCALLLINLGIRANHVAGQPLSGERRYYDTPI